MGALEGFMSVWSGARETFGVATPQDGSQFDRSAQLRQLQSDVQSAAPGSAWTGAGSDTYADANSKHSRTLEAIADLDTRLGAEVDRSAAVVAAGRRDLDAVKQFVVDLASTVPRTAAGEQMLWPVVSKGSSEVAEIIQRSNADLAAIAERIKGLSEEYQALGKDSMNVVEKQSAGGDDPSDVLDLNDIKRLPPGELGPYGYMELVPGSGVWIPDPNVPGFSTQSPEAPLDLTDIEYYPPGALGPHGYMELVPGSGVWVPDPNVPGYTPGTNPQAPLDVNDIEYYPPGALGPHGYMELVPGSGVWVPDPKTQS